MAARGQAGRQRGGGPVTGRTISHYEVLEELGRGGMGVLYRARDTRLGRMVAIKVLRPDAISSTDRRQRFVREAQAASALNHSRIVTIHDIDRYAADGVERDFIVMEHVDGTSLDRLLEPGPLRVDEALDCAEQVAEALAAAHEVGIVHRDIKPANIMVTARGDVKLVDFGLAKLTEPSSQDTEVPTKTAQLRTEEGAVIGTAAYMSPEQAEGHAVDRRTDIFSFGSVLYEMLTGRRAFHGDSQVTTRMAILGETPSPVRSFRKDVPADVERVVSCCLEKRREARYASGTELLEELRRVRERRAARQRASWSRPRVAVPAAVVAVAILGGGAWLWVHGSRVRWPGRNAPGDHEARREGGLRRRVRFRRAREAVPSTTRAGAPLEHRLVLRVRATEPAGAEVAWKAYDRLDSGWRVLGLTPVQGRLPVGTSAGASKAGVRDRRARSGQPEGPPPDADAARSFSQWHVLIPGGQREIGGRSITYDGFWLDRFEVTNRRFKAFVDAGGYRKREYWKQPFVKEGREISWDEALRLFVDKTGRPGPALWELGNFPQGEDEYPVRGVSWFEAAAFAEFEERSLPTVWHWLWATDAFGPAAVVELSNFDGRGPAPVGHHQGLGPFGTYDMAGNVREWAVNASAERRSTLGGAWNEVVYTYRQRYAISPFERPETYGFRLAKDEKPPAPELLRPIERTWRDYSREKPVDDKTFAVYAGLYAYDKTPLEAKAEVVASGSSHWKQERVEYAAAYGGERIPADLYLPTNARPPFQTVVYFRVSRPDHDPARGHGPAVSGFHHPERAGCAVPGLQGHVPSGAWPAGRCGTRAPTGTW